MTTKKMKKYSLICAVLFIGLMVLGYNAMILKYGINSPLTDGSGSDTIVKEAGEKNLVFQKLLDSKIASSHDKDIDSLDLDMAIAKFTPEDTRLARLEEARLARLEEARLARQKLAKIAGGGATRVKKKLVLPVLSGILKYRRVDGNIRRYALLDGKNFCEKEKLKGFTIIKINEKGVKLAKGGKTWFLSVPKTNYTVCRIQSSDKSYSKKKEPDKSYSKKEEKKHHLIDKLKESINSAGNRRPDSHVTIGNLENS